METSILLPADTKVKLLFSIDDNKLQAEGMVVRNDPGSGVAIKFKEGNREERAHLQSILEYVDRTSKAFDNYYLSKIQMR